MIAIQNLLQKIDPASLPFVSNILLQQPHNNPRQAVWPTTVDSDRALLSLQERIPKAANASDTMMRYVTPMDATSKYKVQEKLNGVYVLWKQGIFFNKTISCWRWSRIVDKDRSCGGCSELLSDMLAPRHCHSG